MKRFPTITEKGSVNTMTRKYTAYTADFKLRVALEATKNEKPVNVLASEYSIHPSQVSEWKKQLLENASLIFQGKKAQRKQEAHEDVELLQQQIGKLWVQIDWLKKKHANRY